MFNRDCKVYQKSWGRKAFDEFIEFTFFACFGVGVAIGFDIPPFVGWIFLFIAVLNLVGFGMCLALWIMTKDLP